MAAVFDNRPDTEAATLPLTRAHRVNIGTWLADQWPKAVIAFGIAMTIAWTALLVWSLSFVLDLF
jgi:hypothetical protein